ncbi:MAG TPA: ABC transporter permease, partial [Methanosarcina vacuolata]|nr:ABC transporter permease [Methanosarcina vacuolata]
MNVNFIKTVKEKGVEALSLIVAIAIWQLAADVIVQNKFKLPSFYDVIISFSAIVKSGLIFTDVSTSLINFS